MTILPPLIVHDGSTEALRLVEVITALTPHAEVINAMTKAGVARLDKINQGLLDGTLDTNVPPFAICTKDNATKLHDVMRTKS